ncbi:hypothetical protein ASG25_20600 [Rhizobium sp. Leaf384]|uniref:gluconeogenesis factor YvcK family protein n=1 Tax=Rhizobium sp. Leaf384 TaxID=1736358 RepID=UPI000715CD77|nr:gluconeogenesis factor YvcK family protein [Rhizobium sp. Leaf384]KQS75163.1 hypothetical protein ASG25_20600 [Rhizobium sp. Leaf384]
MQRIVMFSGGSACRSINLALARKDVHLTRVVPAWDSGGSSRLIRERLNILSVGDIRQALMTMAHGERRSGDVVRIFNTRVSGTAGTEAARTEFRLYADGNHPLLQRIEPGLRGAVINYLNTFATAVGDDFDFRNGSIGNFILTGACIAHNGDVNTAIFVFRKLCDIHGDVWPSTLENDLILSGTLRNGERRSPQDALTKLSEADAALGIEDIRLAGTAGREPLANPVVTEAIRSADLIAFGPGSFYTSVLPHLLVRGVVSAVESAACPVLFVGNVLQCRETTGMTLVDLVDRFVGKWGSVAVTGAVPSLKVLANRVLSPCDKSVAGFPYLAARHHAAGERTGYVVVEDDFEDVWNRGQHDGDLVAEQILGLLRHDTISVTPMR